MSRSHTSSKDEHLHMLLTLAANSQTEVQHNCPSDHDMTLFVSGQLEATQHEKMLTHFSSCQDCYSQWQMLADDFEEIPLGLKVKTESRFMLSKWRDWLNPTSLTWATACLLLMLVTVPMLMPTEKVHLLESGYASLQQTAPQQLPQLAQHFHEQISSQSGVLSFSETVPAPEQLAFSQGIKAGVSYLDHAEFTEEMDTSIPELVDYYNFGRWLVLLWSSTQVTTPLPSQFWQQQQQLFSDYQAKIHSPEFDHSIKILHTWLPQFPTKNLEVYEKFNRNLTLTLSALK